MRRQAGARHRGGCPASTRLNPLAGLADELFRAAGQHPGAGLQRCPVSSRALPIYPGPDLSSFRSHPRQRRLHGRYGIGVGARFWATKGFMGWLGGRTDSNQTWAVLCSQAKGDYWCCPGADNIFYPTFLERRVAFMQANPQAVLVHGPAELIDEGGRQARRSRSPALPAQLGRPAPWTCSCSTMSSNSPPPWSGRTSPGKCSRSSPATGFMRPTGSSGSCTQRPASIYCGTPKLCSSTGFTPNRSAWSQPRRRRGTRK